jgi:DNA-binding IclR family transcriptional regulator
MDRREHSDGADAPEVARDPGSVVDGGGPDAARYVVPGLERGLKLLAQFTRDTPQLQAPELARRLGVPRTTVFRLLGTLEGLGFLDRMADGRSYRLGRAVLRLGFEYLASLELPELARPVMDRLRDRCDCPVNLVIRDGREAVYVGKSTVAKPFVSTLQVGARLPLHATVLGRTLLIDADLPALQRLYGSDALASYSPHTPRSLPELAALLAADRAAGAAVSVDFYEPGVSAVAAPVRDVGGEVVAAIGVVLPTARLARRAARDELAGEVRDSAAEVSAMKGAGK